MNFIVACTMPSGAEMCLVGPPSMNGWSLAPFLAGGKAPLNAIKWESVEVAKNYLEDLKRTTNGQKMFRAMTPVIRQDG